MSPRDGAATTQYIMGNSSSRLIYIIKLFETGTWSTGIQSKGVTCPDLSLIPQI